MIQSFDSIFATYSNEFICKLTMNFNFSYNTVDLK